LAAKRGYDNIIYIFGPFLIFLGLIAVALFLQRDVSTLGIISITLLSLYFSARTPVWHTALVVISGVTILLLLVKFEPYRLDRWLIFLHPDADPLGKGFQLRQSLISLGSGGFWGKGLGMSTQKFGYLPQAMSDSIFAIIGEELGIIGTVGIVLAFILLFWLGLRIAQNSSDMFSKTVAIGITVWITLQAFINISSTAGIFPLAGIPLPFFSYGGTHLAIELFAMGLLLQVSKQT
jgi:cell division protein FtsW